MSDAPSPPPIEPRTDRVTLKVILLHLVATFPDLTYDELLQLAIGSMYMDYFTFCNIYPELEASELLRLRARKEEKRIDIDGEPLKRLELTDEGYQVLETMAPNLPPAIRRFLDEAKRMQTQSLRQKREVEASVTPSASRGYDVSLGLIEEGHYIFRLTLELPTEADAKHLALRWEQETAAVYTQILRTLNGDPIP